MYFKWKKKVGSLILAASMVLGTTSVIPVMAADNIEIVLTDITQDDGTTLLGEAKIKVGVKGAGGKVTAVQTALKFSGELKYKSIEFLQGENNPPQCFYIPPNAALANSTGKILPSIATNGAGSLEFTDEETDLFIITFSGDPGKSVTLSLNDDSAAGTYCAVDGSYVEPAEGAQESETALASAEDNEGIAATVKLIMDKVDDFTVSTGEGYADSKITLTITNEKTGSTISTVLNTVSDTKGGHYDSNSSVPTFVVENTVVAGDTYTVELTGNGYVSFKETGVDFSRVLELTNADFVPGDVNSDGKVDADDKTAYEAIKGGSTEYESTYADFNRDGKVDGDDDVFDGIETDTKTAPAKMAAPTLTGGSKKITVSWIAPQNGGADITGYIIKYGTSSTNLDGAVDITDAKAVSGTISNLKSDETYYVQIAAKNEIGIGEYSETVYTKTEEESSSGGGGGGGGGGSSSGGGVGGGSIGGTSAVAPSTSQTAPGAFSDLANYAWAESAVYQLRDKGIISGVSSTEYAPASNIKRGDFILILTRMLTVNNAFTENFADVPVGSYYYNAIGSAKAAGIAQGSGNNFMPEATITRQDLITLAYRAFLAKGYITESSDTTSLDAFADKAVISDYAVTAMASMVKAGIIQGSDGNVNPLGNATRAEVAVMCSRLMGLIK
ncbi:MAG: S-layer homology domain-containing protein [Clostridia bacterium]|nr:S-layer homology domain-containing protein [Clostridia bacterium]